MADTKDFKKKKIIHCIGKPVNGGLEKIVSNYKKNNKEFNQFIFSFFISKD